MTGKTDNVELPTTAYFVLAQSKNAFCDQMKQLLVTQNRPSLFDQNWTPRPAGHTRRFYTENSANQLAPRRTRHGASFYFCQRPQRAQIVQIPAM